MSEANASAPKAKSPQRFASLQPGWYHLTLKPECPRSFVNFAGVTFPKRTCGPRKNGSEVTYDQERVGDELELTAEDLARMETWVGKKVVRVVNADTGVALVLAKNSPGFRSMKGDVPLESFLVLRPIPTPVESGA